MKKLWKVREKFLATGWTFIRADSKEEALKVLEGDDECVSYDFTETDWDHQDTDWNTLQEVDTADTVPFKHQPKGGENG